MTEHAAVLFANEAFYMAFDRRDMEAMEDVWATRAPVTCIHPGWHPIDGRDAVMESWQAILSGSAAPKIKCSNATAHVIGGVAYVTCHEILDRGFLAATNVFVREDGSWKMVHHHAGTAPPPAESDEPASPPTMQ